MCLVAVMVEAGWGQQQREPTSLPPGWLLNRAGWYSLAASYQPPGAWQKSEISEVGTAPQHCPGVELPQDRTDFFSVCVQILTMKQFFWYLLKERKSFCLLLCLISSAVNNGSV